MEYVLEHPTKETAWSQHPFYTSSLVLGLDIGIEGIGVFLRRGREILFGRTFIVTLPKAAPLKNKRQKKAWRRARASRRKRQALLKVWCAKYGLPWFEISEDLQREDQDRIFQRVFLHRYRGIKGRLGSKEALSVCIQHCIKHRGYDYHLMGEEGDFPGTEDFAALKKWLQHAQCPPEFKDEKLNQSEREDWATEGKSAQEKINQIRDLFTHAVRKFEELNIEKALETHLREVEHPNLRAPARGHNFPRESIKDHLFAICRNNIEYFPSEQFDQAMRELLGPYKSRAEKQAWHHDHLKTAEKISDWPIIDYHHRSLKGAEKLWERKRKDCPYTAHLKITSQKCDRMSNLPIRRFFLVQFLAERRYLQKIGKETTRAEFVSKGVYQIFDRWLCLDAAALAKGASRPTITAKRIKGVIERRCRVKLAPDKDTLNEDFFGQLRDLLSPRKSTLDKTASLCAASAEKILQKVLTEKFDPAKVKQQLSDYYYWRKNNPRGKNLYPQVDFLLGAIPQYQKGGDTTVARRGRYKGKNHPGARKDSQIQQHGILRRLFADQLRDEMGNTIQLTSLLQKSETVPDYVIIETIGDIPRHTEERQEIQDAQKASRKAKEKILQQYESYLPKYPAEKQIRQCLLHDQQAGLCPYTGKSLGPNPVAEDLEIDHIFPRAKGGLDEMRNCLLTHRDTNNRAKGDRLPREAVLAGAFRDDTGKVRSWEEIVKGLSAMTGWKKSGQPDRLERIDLFMWEDSDTVPDWGNTTRTAQLARHLREQVIEWLGIKQKHQLIDDSAARENAISNEVRDRIGTPSGFLTSLCRKAWREQLPDSLFRRITRKDGREYEAKNREYLRHHLYDAAVITHIPPGAGMNLVNYGGIFYYDSAQMMRALKSLPQSHAPICLDLAMFEESHRGRCLVVQPRQAKSKQSRFDQSILSLHDAAGKLWKREELAKYADKKKEKDLNAALNRPGLLSPLKVSKPGKGGEKIGDDFLTKKGRPVCLLQNLQVEDWKEGCQSMQFSPDGLKDFLLDLKVPAEKIIYPLLEAEFSRTKDGSRTFDAKQITGFLRKKLNVTILEVSDLQIEQVMLEKASRAILRAPSFKANHAGQIIARVPIEQDIQKLSNLAPHYSGGEKIVGFKTAAEGFLRHEIWQCPQRDKKSDEVIEGKFDYYRLLIPHPRNLENLEKRCLADGRPLSLQLPLTLSDLRELGLLEEANKLEISHQKSVAKFEKELLRHKKIRDKNKESLLPENESQPLSPPSPVTTLRKLICERDKFPDPLPPDCVRIASFKKGMILRVPVAEDGTISFHKFKEYFWYEVTALNSSGKVEMKLTEMKPVKPPSDKELLSGKRKPLLPEQQHLWEARSQEPSKAEVLLKIMELTRVAASSGRQPLARRSPTESPSA